MTERRLYFVTRTRGGAWKQGVPPEGQYDFDGHMDYLRKLHEEGHLVAAGPLEGTEEAMLLVLAEDLDELKRLMEWDSWSANDLLRTTRVHRWSVRAGKVG